MKFTEGKNSIQIKIQKPSEEYICGLFQLNFFWRKVWFGSIQSILKGILMYFLV